MLSDRSSELTGLLFPGWMKRSDGNSDFVDSSNIIMLSQWCTCGVITNLKVLLPVFSVSFSQNDMWSDGMLCHPVRFSEELRSLHSSFVFGALRNSIPPHSSLSKWRIATYDSRSRGITSLTLCSTCSYIPTGPV